jgi:hypothetical protein
MTNREKLIKLRGQLNLTQLGVAELIAKKTGRPCSMRTAHAWEADPSIGSSRPCPDWAIEILEKALQKASAK